MYEEINFIEVKEDFKVCPVCGYQDGFHSMFERIQESNEFHWRFICPSCHKIFDIGMKVSI
jgi:transposase